MLLEVVLSISTCRLLCPELLEQSLHAPACRPHVRRFPWVTRLRALPPGHRGDCRRLCCPGRGHRSECGRRCLGATPLSDVLLDLSGREYTLVASWSRDQV